MADIDRFTTEELAEAFEYLDGLRTSGIANMFGAAPYIVQVLEHDINDARVLLSEWMATFDGDSSVEQRIAKLRGESK